VLFAVNQTRNSIPCPPRSRIAVGCAIKPMSSPKSPPHLIRTATLSRLRIPQRQLITVATTVLVCLLPFLVKGLPQSKSRSRSANQNRGRLSDSVSVQGRVRGNPTINLSNGIVSMLPGSAKQPTQHPSPSTGIFKPGSQSNTQSGITQ
jgi:hypothetical protein